MIFIIIDVLEKLLAWLRPFTDKYGADFKSNESVEVEKFVGKPSQKDVKDKFAALCAGNPSNPKLEGVITENDTDDFVIGSANKGKMANVKVWDTMYPYCGTWYAVRVVRAAAGA